jgi:hypothetical protein
MIDFLRKHNVGISIFLTIISVIIMAYINTSSLWITIPFALYVIASEEVVGDDGGYYGHFVFNVIFWIMLDIFAFRTNTWFGIIFLVLCITIFIVGSTVEALEKFHVGVIVSIVIYNIGKAICHEWSLLECALPSLIGCFILSILGEYLADFLDFKKQLNEYNQQIQAEQQARQNFRKKYVTEDMERIEQLLGISKYGVGNMRGGFSTNNEIFNNRSIPGKIRVLQDFNANLQNNINDYVVKANGIIWEAYRSVLQNVSMNMNDYFWNYNNIYQRYSSALNNPVLAAACDKSVRKIADFVQQKQDIINKNNADIEKYNQLIQRLQKQYDDELALQKIKELNRDVNSQMDDISDIAQKEEKNFEIQNIMSDIDQLDREINERRHLEIQFGQIEI